jgi:hypothetical protein
MANDAADVVCSAGGWIVDRALAGWDVNVFLARHYDIRPLHIIGAQHFPLESKMAAPHSGTHVQVFAVAADLFIGNARVHDNIVKASNRCRSDVIYWGDIRAAKLAFPIDSLQHHLLSAAVAFKAQALQAAAIEEEAVGSIEEFCGWVRPHGSAIPDLAPVS